MGVVGFWVLEAAAATVAVTTPVRLIRSLFVLAAVAAEADTTVAAVELVHYVIILRPSPPTTPPIMLVAVAGAQAIMFLVHGRPIPALA
jgi:hypothetical protein